MDKVETVVNEVNPKTGLLENGVTKIENYCPHHAYAVRFSDGSMYGSVYIEEEKAKPK